VNHRPGTQSGLDLIIEALGRRYAYDGVGRIVRVLGDGILPRFVLGRSVEGCVWRFAADLEPDRVKAVARLAGREPGFPITTTTTGVLPRPPERLVMIERLLSPEAAESGAEHEALARDGVVIAELWTID
jgi:hypothetical protein